MLMINEKNMQKPVVIVVGGSMAGLFTAVSLRQIGCDVDVYERSSEKLQDRGAGLRIDEHSTRVIDAADGAPLDTMSTNIEFVRFIDVEGNTTFETPSVERATSWTVLHNTLLDCFDSSHYHLGKQVTDFSQDNNKATVSFADGDSKECDLLVCADGVTPSVSGTTIRRVGFRRLMFRLPSMKWMVGMTPTKRRQFQLLKQEWMRSKSLKILHRVIPTGMGKSPDKR